MIIREECPGDSRSIHKVHKKAFPGPDEARLVQLLRSRGKAVVSLVAEDDGAIVGHVLCSAVSIDPPDSRWNALGLAPIAVLPENQRKGIGRRLIQEGLKKCKQAGYDVVVVLGDPAYYARFGFRRA